MASISQLQGTSNIIERHWKSMRSNYKRIKKTCTYQYDPYSRRLTNYCWKTDRRFTLCLGERRCTDFITTTDFVKYGSAGKPKPMETGRTGKVMKAVIKSQNASKSTSKKETHKPEKKIRQYKTPAEETAIGNDSKIGKLFAEIYADLPRK